MNLIVSYIMSNYFYDLPVELQERIYIEEHKIKMLEVLPSNTGILKINDTLHHASRFLKAWNVEEDLKDYFDCQVSYEIQEHRRAKLRKNIIEIYDTRIALRRGYLTHELTFIERWGQLYHHCFIFHLHDICKEYNFKYYENLNRRQLVKLIMCGTGEE